MSAPERGKHLLLTGAASGMGRHLCGALLREGHRLCATDVDLAALERAAAADGWPAARLTLRGLDVRDAQAWEQLLDEVERSAGPLDVLMNIAGVLQASWLPEASASEIDAQLDINLKGMIHGTLAAARRMKPRRAGHIVNLASMSALMPVAGLAIYSASKHGVRAFSLAAAYELRPHGVYVTTVCPDPVETPMLARMREQDAAAVAFSGRRYLSVDEIEALILRRVLPHRPLEATLPFVRSWLARLVGMFPVLGLWAAPIQIRLGRRRVAARPPRPALE